MDSPLSQAEALARPPHWTPAPAHLEVVPDADDAAPAPEMNRQERVIVTAYLAMAALIAGFLAIAFAVWLLGA